MAFSESRDMNAGLAPDEVDYVNAHATSTPVGDVAETRVLHQVFGDGVRAVPVSSTKSMTGHLLTAAAAVEALACVAAMEHGALPPPGHLDDQADDARFLPAGPEVGDDVPNPPHLVTDGVEDGHSGEPGDEQADWNHGCSSEVWLTTRSMMTRMPRLSAACKNSAKSPSVPSRGCTL